MKVNLIKTLCKGTLLVAVVTTVGGCTSTQVADLQDSGRVSVGLGFGLDATAKAGSIAHLGLGVVGSRTVHVGHENREWTGLWAEDQYVWPYEWYRRWDIFEEGTHLHDLAAISAYTRDYYPESMEDDPSMEVTYMFPIFEPPPMRKAAFGYGELTDFELGVTLLFFSARIGINPLEIVDAFGNLFFGADIAGDDEPVAAVEECPMEKKEQKWGKAEDSECAAEYTENTKTDVEDEDKKAEDDDDYNDDEYEDDEGYWEEIPAEPSESE